MFSSILRTHIWLANLPNSEGNEQAGKRPVLVVSDDEANANPSGIIVVVPLTSKVHRAKHFGHLLINPPEGGLKMPSVVLCEQPLRISKKRFVEHWGTVSNETMQRVEGVLRDVLDL